jgi:hypothetical protein
VALTVNGRNLNVEFIRASYDVERTARAIEVTPERDGMPHIYAHMLRQGAG